MRFLVIACALSLLTTGCIDAKSDDQIKAEQLCAQVAVNKEAERTPGFKMAANVSTETQLLAGPKHYLIRVTYKIVTLDDPGKTSNDPNAYSGATCEVKNGDIVDGKMDMRLIDRLRLQQ